jgi:hypothetical protein
MILDNVADRLVAEYPEMFKPSMRCRAPHLNADAFRDSVFESDVLNRRRIMSADALLAHINEVNERYSKRSDGEWEEVVIKSGLIKTKGKALEQAIAKARKFNFFLGLDTSWMYDS